MFLSQVRVNMQWFETRTYMVDNMRMRVMIRLFLFETLNLANSMWFTSTVDPESSTCSVRYDQMKDYNFRATISILVVPFGNNFLGHFVANFKEDFLDYMSRHYDQLRRTIQNHNNFQPSFELVVWLPTLQGYVFTF